MPSTSYPVNPQIVKVVRPQPVVLSRTSIFRRVSPRPLAQQQAGYADQFDDSTLFYDVFRSGEDVVLNGPPLLNLKADLGPVEFSSEARVFEHQMTDAQRTQQSRILNCPSNTLKMESALGTLCVEVGTDLSELFRDKHVLTTKSKNNELQWIADWARFHSVHHGVNAVLIYDNGSDKYMPEDVASALATVQSLHVVVVVSWPFRFGPQGGSWDGVSDAPWDSDFCEYGIQEHAHHRFLRTASGIINADVDELVMTTDGSTVFEVLERSNAAWISYEGQWIESVARRVSSPPRFTDFSFFDRLRPPTTRKWTANPKQLGQASQLKPHSISNSGGVFTSEVIHRHFMGLSSNWKWNRTEPAAFAADRHRRDNALETALALARFEALPTAPESSAPHPYYAHLQRILDAAEPLLAHHSSMVSKTWFYKENCLVFEVLEPVTVGFDLVREGEMLTLKVVGRNVDAQERLDLLCTSLSTATRVSERGHWKLASIPASVPERASARQVYEHISDLVFLLGTDAA